MSENSGSNRRRRRGRRRPKKRNTEQQTPEAGGQGKPQDAKSGLSRRGRRGGGKSESKPNKPSERPAPTGPVYLQNVAHLTQLRDYVVEAVDEIERLREENEELHTRITELEEMRHQQPQDDLDLLLDDESDPERVRAKIEGFITAIDGYLAQHAPAEETEEDDDDAVIDIAAEDEGE